MCIDIVHNQDNTKIMNGGSCANVISVLSQIGFDCSIIRERYSDIFDAILSKTMLSLGVTEIIYKKTLSKTPKIIEILTDSEHKFLTSCPRCGAKTLKLYLPTEHDIENAGINFANYNIFYSDRSSSGIRRIMDAIRKNCGIVFYEPNTSRNIESLLESSHHTDIIKFSKDKIYNSLAEKIRTTAKEVKLIISTEGKEGLSFSHIQRSGKMSDWVHIPSEFNGPVIDSSGAGDWLTAGFISELIKNDTNLSKDILYDTDAIINMLIQGMKYSQLCCAAIGAQGVFYSEQSVGAFNKLNNHSQTSNRRVLINEQILSDGLCPLCLSKIG